MTSTAVFCQLLSKVKRCTCQVVWLAPPCESFSVLHFRKSTQPLLTTAEPEGFSSLSETQRTHVEEHIEFAVRLAFAAYTRQASPTWWRTQ